MPEQPGHMEVVTTMYDCGVCGDGLLDRVIVYPDKPFRAEWFACPHCGWDDVDDDERGENADNEWYNERYGG